MAFWTNATGRDPKRAYRFMVSMTPGGGTQVDWFVKKVGKPSVSVSESSHTFLNHTFYYPGRVSWNTINMTFVDPVSPDAAGLFMDYLQNAGYVVPTNETQVTTISKRKATQSGDGGLGEVRIQQMDGDGIVVEEWLLHNAWVKSINLDDLDYESDALANVNLEIRYDWAELTVHGPLTNSEAAPGSTMTGDAIFTAAGGSGPIGGGG